MQASEFDVLINEICYHPFGDDDRDEFVELYNRGPTAIDLAGWSLIEGISFVFPSNTSIGPGEYLVLSPDAERTRLRRGISNVIGNYTGRLDDGGEILTLSDARRRILNRVHYADGGTWPSHPDGLGPTLELVTPHEQNDLPQKWASSLTLDGTPGRRNSRFVPPRPAQPLVSADDLFVAFKGTQEPSGPPALWTRPEFTLGPAWSEAQGPFGLGTYEFNTELTDMLGSYTTYYIRRSFDLDPATLNSLHSGEVGIVLRATYDDGLVAYLNGSEVGRANLGSAGVPVPHDAVAPGRGEASVTISLDPFIPLLTASGNVLAIQGANAQASNDFFLSAELILSARAVSVEEVRRTVVINEVRPSEGAGANGFLELYNATAEPAAVSGFSIIDSRGAVYRLPNPTVIGAGTFAAFAEGQLGFPPSLSGAAYALVSGDGATWVDGIVPQPPAGGAAGYSYGRFPDGGEDQYLLSPPSSGAPNQLALETSVVLNEIMFHPPFVAPAGDCLRQCSDPDQWIEVHNRGPAELDLKGWSLSKAVDFTITGSIKIEPGGYLVIAADRSRFLARYPGVAPVRVLGGWQKSLGRDTDTINLRDAIGNRVDHVKFGDGSPANDESPEDGIDDRTVSSSEWPAGADDGDGRTLELVNPALDNRAGPAWGVGPPGGTPAAANSRFDAAPAPVVWEADHSPVVPHAAEAVLVTCRVSSVVALEKVEAEWHVEPAGAVSTVTLRDDGASGDGEAADGVYGGMLPGQADRTVVGFRIRAQAAGGLVTVVPRSPGAPPYAGFSGPYYLYQVGETPPPANDSPVYRIVMAEADRAQLFSRPVTSDVLLPCTFIADGKAFHTIGLRFRGESTRQGARKPYRLDFPPERRFRDTEHLNLVSNQIHHELLASDLFRRAALPSMTEWAVNLVFQGTLDPLYVHKENMDGDFLQRWFGGSSGGNFYRAIDPLPAGGQPQGDLMYYGEDPDDLLVYREVYDKRSNREEDDYSDIIELCRAFDPVQTPDAQFAETIEPLIDANEWAQFFAVQAALSNIDGGIQNSSGEDYLLYRVPMDSPRPDRGKWLLLPWDIEETYSNAEEQLFRPNIPAIRRFIRHPQFAPLYYANLVDLRDGIFSRSEMRQRYYLIDDLFGFAFIDINDTYVTERIGFFDENVPVILSAGALGSVGGGLIAGGEVWKYFKGQAEPSGGNRSWTNRTFNDDAWLEGPTGIGYGDGDDATSLLDMQGSYRSVYLRKRFQVPDPAQITTLSLIVLYDDGFVAYLNGSEVARRNAPGNPNTFVAFDDEATQGHEAGTQPETIDLAAFRNLLVPGENVLAIQALNEDVGSTDLSIIPALTSGTQAIGAGCGEVLYSTGSSIFLGGRADAARTREVTVNGAPATYSPSLAVWTGAVALVLGENTVRVEAFDELGTSLEAVELKVHRLARPFTVLGGPLSSSATWSAAGGPYLLNQNVTVAAGARLTIEPGTVILGQAGASIIVQGELSAVGTAEAPILFRAYSCQSRMGGIAFDGTGVEPASPLHHLRYVELEFGSSPAGFEGTIAPVGSKLLMEDCSLRELTGNAVDGIDAQVEVRRSRFERIHEGVHCTRSLVVIVDCTFTHMIGDSDGIDFDDNDPGGQRSRIERCLIEYSSDDGIDLQATTVDIRDNVFRFVQDKAMSLQQNGPLGGPTITGNLVHDSGTAIALKNGVTISEGHHNTLVGNQEGLNLFAKGGAPAGGHGVFHSMIIWDNIFDVKLDSLSTVSFTFSDIGQLWPGQGNIAADPRFRDQLEKDYSLLPASPAAGTGKDGTDMGSIPFSGVRNPFIRGDANADKKVNVTDVLVSLEYLFREGAGPSCLDRLDGNDDGEVDVADPIFTLFYLFAGGAPPRAPFPNEGIDETPDDLSCP